VAVPRLADGDVTLGLSDLAALLAFELNDESPLNEGALGAAVASPRLITAAPFPGVVGALDFVVGGEEPVPAGRVPPLDVLGRAVMPGADALATLNVEHRLDCTVLDEWRRRDRCAFRKLKPTYGRWLRSGRLLRALGVPNPLNDCESRRSGVRAC